MPILEKNGGWLERPEGSRGCGHGQGDVQQPLRGAQRPCHREDLAPEASGVCGIYGDDAARAYRLQQRHGDFDRGREGASRRRTAIATPPKIAVNSFQLVQFDHGIADFTKGEETQTLIKEKLYPAFRDLLLREMQASEVIVFNHGLRVSGPSDLAETKAAPVKAPIKEAHSDFSPALAPSAAAKLAEERQVNLTERWCLVNLWMSVDQNKPIMTTPLAFLDATSVEESDLLDNYVLTGGTAGWSGQMERAFRALLKVGLCLSTTVSHES